jgi:ABC-2 type transport system permease protein
MNIARVRMMALRVIIQFRRDRRTLGLVFVVPIVIITLLAFLMRSTGGNVSLALVNEDSGIVGGLGAGPLFTSALKTSSKMQVSEMNRSEAEKALRDGRVNAAAILGSDFSRSLVMDHELRFQLLLEGSNPMDTSSVMQALSETAQQTIATAGTALGVSGAPKVDIQTSYLYGGPQFDVLDLFAPAWISFFIFFLVFLLTCVSFLRERMQGTMERLMATPAGRGEIVLGYTLGFGLFAVIQSLIVLLWCVYVLNIHYVGNLLLIFVVEAILTVVAVGMGIFLSIFARNELQAVQFIPIVIVPQAFLSGFIWQIRDMPNWLQPFAYLMPMTYGIRALRDVMIKGFGILEVAPDLTILILLAVGTLALATLSLQREAA